MWGATEQRDELADELHISIHAPRVGSDRPLAAIQLDVVISIHAPRVGSDGPRVAMSATVYYFNPRSPCGERLDVRGERAARVGISIHAPRVGSDFRFVQHV